VPLIDPRRMVLPSAPARSMVHSGQATATGGPRERSIRRRIVANSVRGADLHEPLAQGHERPPRHPVGRREAVQEIGHLWTSANSWRRTASSREARHDGRVQRGARRTGRRAPPRGPRSRAIRSRSGPSRRWTRPAGRVLPGRRWRAWPDRRRAARRRRRPRDRRDGRRPLASIGRGAGGGCSSRVALRRGPARPSRSGRGRRPARGRRAGRRRR
jgi:hypothetical protein